MNEEELPGALSNAYLRGHEAGLRALQGRVVRARYMGFIAGVVLASAVWLVVWEATHL